MGELSVRFSPPPPSSVFFVVVPRHILVLRLSVGSCRLFFLLDMLRRLLHVPSRHSDCFGEGALGGKLTA